MILIARDDNDAKHNYLLLFVNLDPTASKKLYFYSYGFSIHDKNLTVIDKPIFTRSDAAKYLPPDLSGKILPLVLTMTKDLIERINPPTIIRESMEFLVGNSIKRYDKITDLLVNELGYKIERTGVTPEGKNYWVMIKNDGQTVTIDESYELNDSEKRWIITQDHIMAILTPEVVKEVIDQYDRNQAKKKKIKFFKKSLFFRKLFVSLQNFLKYQTIYKKRIMKTLCITFNQNWYNTPDYPTTGDGYGWGLLCDKQR